MLTVKLLQTTQKIKILGSDCRVYKKWQTSAVIREIFDLLSGDQEIGSRIWSLPDYPRELTALVIGEYQYKARLLQICYMSRALVVCTRGY